MKAGQVVRYWHPVKGGWYGATIVKYGRKWAKVRVLAPTLRVKDGKWEPHRRVLRVPIASVKPATIQDLLGNR